MSTSIVCSRIPRGVGCQRSGEPLEAVAGEVEDRVDKGEGVHGFVPCQRGDLGLDALVGEVADPAVALALEAVAARVRATAERLDVREPVKRLDGAGRVRRRDVVQIGDERPVRRRADPVPRSRRHTVHVAELARPEHRVHEVGEGLLALTAYDRLDVGVSLEDVLGDGCHLGPADDDADLRHRLLDERACRVDGVGVPAGHGEGDDIGLEPQDPVRDPPGIHVAVEIERDERCSPGQPRVGLGVGAQVAQRERLVAGPVERDERDLERGPCSWHLHEIDRDR